MLFRSIGHPPCTYLSTVGNRWFKTQPDRYQKREEAMNFFLTLYNANVPRVAIENPQGYPCSSFRKPDQIIQPFYFGDAQRKRTCLWLRGLPKLSETVLMFPPRPIHYNKEGKAKHWCEMLVRLPLNERSRARSRTFPGIAQAMAEQWTASRKMTVDE